MSSVLKCLDAANSDQIAIHADRITESLQVIPTDHAANHYGYGYKAGISITDLAAGASLSYCLTGGSNRFNHIKNLVASVLGSSARVEIIRGADVTVNTGTVIALNNTNDNSDRVAGSTLKASPTYTGGTVWDFLEIYAESTGTNAASSSLNLSSNEELVTKADSTPYILKITNIGTSNLKKAWLKLFFYEEPKGLI